MRVTLAALLLGALAVDAQDGVSFERDVLPLFEENCFSCHSAEKRKPKGGLRLDGRAWILAGGATGRVVAAGQPDKSPLYLRASLPDDHDDVMPPSGDVLEKKQLTTIRRWIAEGARFGDWKGAAGPEVKKSAPVEDVDPSTPPARFEVYARLGDGLAAAPGKAIETARAAGARVEPVVPKSALLRVEFVADPAAADDKAVRALLPLRHHIAVLGLGETKITDRALPEIGKMPRLVRLDLFKTAITDDGLKTLAKQKPPELRRLNVYGTGITDRGLDAIALLGKLERLHLWGTKASEIAVAELRRVLPRCRIHHERTLPAAEGAREEGERRRRRR